MVSGEIIDNAPLPSNGSLQAFIILNPDYQILTRRSDKSDIGGHGLWGDVPMACLAAHDPGLTLEGLTLTSSYLMEFMKGR